MRVYFHFLSGTRQDQVVELDVVEGRPLRIGRDPAADLAFNLDFEYPVSRAHATIELKGGKVVLKDVGSSLGTTVQGQRIEANKGVVLKSTYRLQFGGELGPLCRFYIETDLKRCPLCQGPLFKNNFTCVFCAQKVCFTHFDETYKCCSACADAKRQALVGGAEAAAAGAAPSETTHSAAEGAVAAYPDAGPGYPSASYPSPAYPGAGYAGAGGPGAGGYQGAAYPGAGPTPYPQPAPAAHPAGYPAAFGAHPGYAGWGPPAGAPAPTGFDPTRPPPVAPPRADDPRRRTVVANAVCERCGSPTRAGESFCIGCRPR